MKVIKGILRVILYLAGFPLLLIVTVLRNIPIIKAAPSYGIMTYVAIILTAVLAIAWFLTVIIMAKTGRKTVYRQTFVAMLVGVFMTTGLWIAVDKVFPDIFSDATSGTIHYEDLDENELEWVETYNELLESFITRNYNNGNLDQMDLDAYLADGWKNAEVQNLLSKQHKSIDTGYKSFSAPWLDLANSSRLTIPVLVHLIVDQREKNDLPYPLVVVIENADGSTTKTPGETPMQWSILDMMGEPMEFEVALDGIVPEEYKGLIKVGSKAIIAAIDPILAGLSNAIADEAVAGSPIYISVDLDSDLVVTASVIPTNEKRGVVDYMHNAWLESSDLLVAVATFFSTRYLYLMFSGVIIVTTYLIMFLRKPSKKDIALKGEKCKCNDPAAAKAKNPIFDMDTGYRSGAVVIPEGTKDVNYFSHSSARLYQVDPNKVSSQKILEDLL